MARQDFRLKSEIGEDYSVIGKYGVKRIFGWPKTAGTAEFTRDVQFPGLLYAASVRCPYGHAKVKSINNSRALAVPGVRGYIDYRDPSLDTISGARVLRGEGWYEGAPCVAVIAADTYEIAAEAIRILEEDIEWEVLPFFLDGPTALASSDILYPNEYPDSNEYFMTMKNRPSNYSDPELNTPEKRKAAFESAYNASPVKIEKDIKYRRMYHCGAEPRAYVYKWEGDELHMWSHSQTQSTEGPMAQGDRLLIPRKLGIPSSHMIVHPTFQGGSYGGTISLELINVAVAKLAHNIQMPISFLQSRADEFGRNDMELTCKLKIGCEKNGYINAVDINAVCDVGDSGIEGEGFIWELVAPPMDMPLENLKTKNISYENHVALTSRACATSFRCEKNQTAFTLAKIHDLVSHETGVNPAEIMLLNARCATKSPEQVLEIARKEFNWDKKWHDPTKGLKIVNGKYHGVGMTWAHMWHSGGGGQGGSANASMDYDGAIEISGCLCDCGVSAHTTYVMMIADEMGADPNRVRFSLGMSNSGYAPKTPGGSVGCTTNAYIMHKAGFGLRQKYFELLHSYGVMGASSPDDYDSKDGYVWIKSNPSAKMTFEAANAAIPSGHLYFPISCACDSAVSALTTYKQKPPYHCEQVVMAEVLVDPDTGKVEVVDSIIVDDFGKMIRPEGCLGQMYGGFYMLWGRCLSEEMIYDPVTGSRLNDNLLDYKYSLIGDAPAPVCLPQELNPDVGQYGAVGSGEPTASGMDTVLNNAVSNALNTCILQSPVLPQDIIKIIEEKGLA